LAKKGTDSTEILKDLVIEAILEKKGQDIVSLDLRDIHDTVSDYFVIAHGDSSTQVNAIFQSILESTKKQGMLPYHSEGMKNGEWVIVDFVDVVAHIFYREKRDFYMLEELWSDAKITKHNPESAIKPKAVRPSNRKYAPVSEDTLEDIEKTLPKHERTPVKEFTGRPFARRNFERAEKKAAEGSAVEKKTRDKKLTGKQLSDKKFVDKKIQERKAAGKKAPAEKPDRKAPARKVSESKAPASRRVASPGKTITKKK